MDDKQDRVASLEEEVKYLRDERRKAVEALEMAANLGRFDTGSEGKMDSRTILSETAFKLKSLIDFKGIAFYLVNENDSAFYMALCDPRDMEKTVQEEVDRLISDHTFAWVLRRGKAVLIKSHTHDFNLLLRSMTTPSRVRGMFVGILEQDIRNISDTIYSLLSIVILSSSSALESIETYNHMRFLNSRLEKQALERERMYKDIFENAPIAIFRSTPDGKFLKVNPKYAEIAGYDSPEEMVASITDIGRQLYVNSEDRERYKRELAAHGHVFNFQVQLKKTDNTLFWASMNTRTIKNNHGRIIYYDGFLMDITEQIYAQQALIQAKEAAETASRTKSEFMANMSHELRTPLNGMLGMLQLLEHSGLGKDQKEFVDLAIKAGQRLTDLLGNILDLCKIDKGMLVIDEKPLSIRDLFIHLEDTFSLASQEKGINWQTYIAEDIPEQVIGDEVRLKSILFNLAGNAVKFTRQGTVKLEAWTVGQKDLCRIFILFVISDTGIGFPNKMEEDIFEPFIQAEGSYTRKYQGAGLGLSVVKRTVNILEGSLCFESREGQGSTFYLSLPFQIPESDAISAQDNDQPMVRDQRLASRTVLIVEDEPTNLFFAEKMLQKMGFKTLTADDGTTALDVLEQSKVDCILMDIQLKQMDGVQTTRAIRKHDGSKFDPDIPIVATTSYAMEGDREKFLKEGMNNYIPKPLKSAELKALLKKIFENQ